MNPLPTSTPPPPDVVGTQIRLPFRRAFAIVLGGMLGIAFLMNNLTTPILRKAVAHEREVRRESDLMLSVVRGEIGVIEGKSLAVTVFGTPNAGEQRLVG